MATYQTTYTEKPDIGIAGQIVNTELANTISREVETAAGIAFGQPAFRGTDDHGVVAGAAFAATATRTPDENNTGNGVILQEPVISSGALAGRYTITIIKEAADGGEFTVEGPGGSIIGSGVIGTEYSADSLTFTITDGTEDHNVGDIFYIDVTLTANVIFAGLAVMSPAVAGNATNPDQYKHRFTGAFMTLGVMYVTAGAAVADGDAVYWNPATKRYTNTATHVPIPGAVFDATGVDGGLVPIALKLR